MHTTPESLARQNIDSQLTAACWAVHNTQQLAGLPLE